MHRQMIAVIAFLLVIAVELPVMAGIKGGEVTVSPFAGTVVYDGSQQLDPSFAAGIRLGYNLDRNWGVESQILYTTLRSNVNSGGQYNASGDLLYHFIPDSKAIPYLLVGGGWSETDYVTGNSSNAIFEYGAGIKYYLNDAVALRWDVRQMYSLHPNSGTSVGYWQNSAITLGLSYQFGGTKPVSPAVQEILPPAAAVQPVESGPKTAGEEPLHTEPSSWQAENTIASAGKILITGMRVDRNEFEIFASEPIRNYKLFTLSEPSRLVVDIANGESGFLLEKVVINRLGIATVRFETYPDYLRIYFDAAQGRMIPYRIEETASGLKIIVTGP